MSFQVPTAFAALFDAGCFDYWGGVPYHDMTDEERKARYAERRSKVLWVDGIEWMPERSPAAIAAAPESAEMLPGLVQFAQNGAGDAYCWYLPWQDGAAEPPVLMCPHDSTVAEYFAPDFARTLERLWLDHGRWSDNDPRDQVLADLRAWLELFAPFLEPARVATLRQLAVAGTPADFKADAEALVAGWPRAKDELRGHNLLSTRYTVEYLGDDALRLYDESIAFYEKLVADGYQRFAAKLEETRANRAKAVEELAKKKAKKKPAKPASKKAKPARKTKPKPKAKPKAKPAKKPAKKAKARPAKKPAKKRR
jgi:hypothetical protein